MNRNINILKLVALSFFVLSGVNAQQKLSKLNFDNFNIINEKYNIKKYVIANSDNGCEFINKEFKILIAKY